MEASYITRDGKTWVSYWEPNIIPVVEAGTELYYNEADERFYIPYSPAWGGSSGINISDGYSYIERDGETWVSKWEPGTIPIIDAGTPLYYNEADGRFYIPLRSSGGSSGGGSSGGGSSGGSSSGGVYYGTGAIEFYPKDAPRLNPGDFPPGYGDKVGAFSPGPSWSPGPPPSPGPSTPVFDPPIRPPADRSGILFPVEACWLLDTHTGQDEEIYARVDMDTGPARLRRKYTQVPHVRNAKIFLTFEESKIFHEWFEWTIGVGQLRWIGQFHDIGYGIRWFEAEFVSPWEAEYVSIGRKNEEGNAERAWKISVSVRLYGEGELHNPLLDPNANADFRGKIQIPLVTQSSLRIDKKFTGSIEIPLTSTFSDVTFAGTITIPLDSKTMPEQGFYGEIYTYLSSSVTIGGWARLGGRIVFGLHSGRLV